MKQDETKRARQHELSFRTWGGVRRGAGRKRARVRECVPHSTRDAFVARHPLHITLRLQDGLPTLRSLVARTAFEGVVRRLAYGGRFRVVHYALLPNHVHLVVEASDRHALARMMQGFTARTARVLNAAWRRRGTVFADRYHARTLATPREVRNALGYVLKNAAHHGLRGATPVDPYSSGAWFDGWVDHEPRAERASPCAKPRTWLLGLGWRRGGRIETATPARRTRP